jgi:hypothetical protein
MGFILIDYEGFLLDLSLSSICSQQAADNYENNALHWTA